MDTLGTRVPIGALSDIETFLNSAQHLKGLLVFRAERKARVSNLDMAIGRLMEHHRQVCQELADKSAQVAALWRVTQAELQALEPAAAPAQPRNMSKGGR